MRKTLNRGTTLACALALVVCAGAWLAPAALGSDSVYWSSYTNSGAIRFGDLGGSGARNLFTGESSPDGVAIDVAAAKIYWADTTSGAIRVANLDGTGARDLYTGETQASGVAIDPAAGRIYWADAVSGTGTIRVGNLDGTGAAGTLFAGESYPVGLTIDPAAGKIYWGSYDTFKIRVGNLNGTGASDLFTGENYPTQLAIDPAAGKLYWTDEFAGTVRVGNLDGTGAASLYSGEGDVGGVAIDPSTGKIYWSDWNHGTVRVGSLNGAAPAQSLYTGETDPWMLALLRAPLGTGAPQVAGGTGIGQTLTCSPGTWAPDLLGAFLYRAPQRVVYQWTAGGAPIAGATTSSLVVSSPGEYRCERIATNAAGSTTQTSAARSIAGPPALISSAPSVAGSAGAGFSGSVNPEGLPTTAHFEYGLDASLRASPGPAYDQRTPDQAIGSDFAGHALTASVSGLVPNARYHVRLVATNSAGVTFGPDQTFTTRAARKPPAPVLGRTENAAPVAGKVFVLINGRFVPLTGATQIRSGAEINALHGTLSLTTATGIKKKTQTGKFGGAVFKVTQASGGASKGLTTLTLVNNAFKGAPSYATCKAHKALDASAAAASRRTLQLLRASAHGKFRTRGRYSAATVRGTVWSIADRCDGTLTHDVTHSVVVNDFVRHKTIVLRAGQSYLAKKP
jgi:putative pyrroloquinoline-quinone binding quinoprotein